MTQRHISSLGINHRKTKQHILHVAELLNGLNRGEDALTFLNHAWDTAASQDDEMSKETEAGRKSKCKDKQQQPTITGQQRLQQINEGIILNPSPATVNHGLDAAELHANGYERAVEALLRAIEHQCTQNPANLVVQGLRARSELLKYYIKHNVVADHYSDFSTVTELFVVSWARATWDRESFKCHEIIEASMELAAAVLRADLTSDANWMFHEIRMKTSNVFGVDDERTIWTAISIGLVYQRYRTWSEARPWFEQAYAAADAVWGLKDGITKSLEKSLEKRYFSYINDEGRPFKTIFGVSGMKIMPTRLHIE